VDLLCRPELMRGRMGAGTVHYVAFRARDNAEQLTWRDAIVALGYNVTPVLDRQYFRSIYFREPGGSRSRRIISMALARTISS
jgi:hypothetical protein